MGLSNLLCRETTSDDLFPFPPIHTQACHLTIQTKIRTSKMANPKSHPWRKKIAEDGMIRRCKECRRPAREGSLKCGLHDGLLNGFSDGKYYRTVGKYKKEW
jgi:hypothetical protein